MNRSYLYYLIVVAVGIILTFYFYATQIVKPMFALEVDPTKDSTVISNTI
jgi:hypothetical protein